MRTFPVATALLLLIGGSVEAATPAEQRMEAARELQATFDGSLVKGFELKFMVRGSGCDVLHVEGYTNRTAPRVPKRRCSLAGFGAHFASARASRAAPPHAPPLLRFCGRGRSLTRGALAKTRADAVSSWAPHLRRVGPECVATGRISCEACASRSA